MVIFVKTNFCFRSKYLESIPINDYHEITHLFIHGSFSQIDKYPHFYEMVNINFISYDNNEPIPNSFANFIHLIKISNPELSLQEGLTIINNDKMYISELKQNTKIPENIKILNISEIYDSESFIKLNNLPNCLEYLRITLKLENILKNNSNNKFLDNLPFTLKKINIIIDEVKNIEKIEKIRKIVRNIKIPFGCKLDATIGLFAPL